MARMIANSLFDRVDPNSTCIKHRINEVTGRTTYFLANGNFKEYMRKSITKSKMVSNFTPLHGDSYSTYMSLSNDDWSALALKLLSIFGYIIYEIVGGEEPEIFIRLNDPNKVKGIVFGNIHYSNNYVTKAKQKHDRDVNILTRFFTEFSSDTERWNYIEDYFLGYDVLSDSEEPIETVDMRKSVDKERSYTTNAIKKWADMYCFFDESDHVFIKKLEELGVQKPEYLETNIKKSELGDDILMSWPSKDTLICQHETADSVMRNFATMGWHAYRVSEIDYKQIVKDLS
jgi:ATP-dependent DNA helicase RecQ